MAAFSDLVGKRLRDVRVGDDKITFEMADGARYLMHHDQDCCESVYVESIDGDLRDLVGEEIVVAEERSSSGEPDKPLSSWDDSYTWTFYTLRTVKASVTIRWYGSSNGYYSESVDFSGMSEED